jgi:hypothetical protein
MNDNPFTSSTFGRPTPSQLASWKERLPQAPGYTFLYCEELASNAPKGAKPDQTTYLVVDGKAIYASSMNSALPAEIAAHGGGVSAIALPGQSFNVASIVDMGVARSGKVYEIRAGTYDGFLAGCDKIEVQRKVPKGSIRRFFEKYRATLERGK